MTRVLRYPRMSALACMGAMLCALTRDFCVSASLYGWARVLRALILCTAYLLLQDILMLLGFAEMFFDFRKLARPMPSDDGSDPEDNDHDQ